MELLGYHCKWIVLVMAIVYFCLKSGVDGNQELSKKYTDLITDICKRITHPYRGNTAVMTGGHGVIYVSLTSIASDVSSLDLILSHRDLSLVGYRASHSDHRVVFLFSDSNPSVLHKEDYDVLEQLPFGGNHQELTMYANRSLQQVEVSAMTLQTGIYLLKNLPIRPEIPFFKSKYTEKELTQVKHIPELLLSQVKHKPEQLLLQITQHPEVEKAIAQLRAEILLFLVLIVSEGVRFTEIQASVREALAKGKTWHPSCEHISLMNSWEALSTFIADNSQDVTASSKQYFSQLGRYVTLKEALDMTAVILRRFQTPHHKRPKAITTLPQSGDASAIDAAIPDGQDHVYLINGPNFVYLNYVAGANNDNIVGTVKSIFMDWPFLQGTEFVKGLSAAFRVPDSSVAFIFRGNLCAMIDVSNKSIISGPKTISDSWPSLRDTDFVNGFDTAFHSDQKDEVHLFLDDQYVRVHYELGTTNDYIMDGPSDIYDSWPTWHDTIFENGFDCAFDRPGLPEVYLFKSDQFMYDNNYNAEGNDDRHLTNSTMLRDGWMSLKQTCFDIYNTCMREILFDPPTTETLNCICEVIVE